MEVLVEAIKDLLKYSIIAQVDTGDKTLDNLANTLFLGIIAIIFTKSIWMDWYHKLLMWRHSRTTGAINLTIDNFEYYQTRLTANKKLNYATWRVSNDKVFTASFCRYFQKNIGWTLGACDPVVYDMKTMVPQTDSLSLDSPLTIIKNSLSEDPIPVYICKSGNVVGICLDDKKEALCLMFEEKNNLEEFLAAVSKYKSAEDASLNDAPTTEKKTIYIKFWDARRDRVKIYEDRTFDRIITKHKDIIMNSLKDFQQSLDGKSTFNGFGTYNLGFMLHGKPGTGKTSIIKAVCNYLQRNAYVVDMTKIKTVEQFENIFAHFDHTNVVYVFEEFDCVQGVIADRSGNEEVVHNKEKEDLKTEYMKIMKLKSQATGDTADIDSDLKRVREEIQKLDEALRLDTMLTVLDGVVEMRGRVIIATTNYIDQIDSALMREGRFDLKIRLDEFNDAEAKEMLTMMFQDIASKKEFAKLLHCTIRDGEFTPVKIINLCQQYRSLSKVIDIMQQPKII